ncbi:MAG: flagellar biosynthesis anti-sigma factor FlgM [Lachnospiraceae bacterium]|nr:flagellar biosynthesis anti-sigma factor FlgM [Lachnospiraceae bacterium]
MRIGNFTQVQQLYNVSQAGRTGKTEKKGFSDAFAISESGKDITSAKAAVADAADVRTDLVASIKAKIDAGTYDVSAEDFADKIVSKFAGVL